MKWFFTIGAHIEASSREDAETKIAGMINTSEYNVYDLVPEGPVCEVEGCPAVATVEGWFRRKDFAGLDTNLIQKRKVCDFHSLLLIGSKPTNQIQETRSEEEENPPEFPIYYDAQDHEHAEF